MPWNYQGRTRRCFEAAFWKTREIANEINTSHFPFRNTLYEDVYLRDYLDGLDLGRGLGQWFADYNESRPHQALNYACPGDVYRNPESHGARTMK